jgi:hypothetical protein
MRFMVNLVFRLFNLVSSDTETSQKLDIIDKISVAIRDGRANEAQNWIEEYPQYATDYQKAWLKKLLEEKGETK